MATIAKSRPNLKLEMIVENVFSASDLLRPIHSHGWGY
jgi:hypothetical protein